MEESNKDLDKYPRLLPKPIDIKDMSIAYLKTQIEKIKHTGINSEYEENLIKEYKLKTRIIFKNLL